MLRCVAGEVRNRHHDGGSAARLRLDPQRVALTEGRPQARVDVAEPDSAAGARQQRGDALGLDPAAVV